MKRKHAQSNVESENPKINNFTENGLKLKHPFTMMVAACTGGGRRGLSKIYLKTKSSGFLLHHSKSFGFIIIYFIEIYLQRVAYSAYKYCSTIRPSNIYTAVKKQE